MKGDDPKKVYADIIDLPYKKNPNRQHMSLYDRAAQFAPFAALSGYDDMVQLRCGSLSFTVHTILKIARSPL